MLHTMKETITLVPRVVLDKAKQLRKVGLFKQALEILSENKIEVDVYDDHLNMRIYKPRREESYRSKKKRKNEGNYFKNKLKFGD